MTELEITLDTTDYDVKIFHLRDDTLDLAPDLLIDTGLIIAEEESKIVPVKTGTLKKSIRFTPLSNDEGEVSTNSGYGLFVDQPTRPHIIRARRAEYLRIPLPDGTVIFRKSVFHTGTDGAFFRRQALLNSAPRINEAMGNRLTDMMAKWQ